MRVVVSGGGTAGHINPALALSEELISRKCDVCFAGTPKGVEATLVPQAGVEFVAFEAQGFNRNHPTTIIKMVKSLRSSSKKAQKWLAEIEADCVVGFGGYASVPVCRAAHKSGIPIVIHEQNSVIGLANKQLAKYSSVVCLTYDCAARGQHIDLEKIVVTGNPVRKSVLQATRSEGRMMLGVPNDALLLLVFGGSLGARHINEAICDMKDDLLSKEDMYIVHITGPKEFDSVKAKLNLTKEQEKRWKLFGYQNQMGLILAATDAVVSRSGASSLAEISALAIPALLVPFPYATADHQTTNARAYVQAGCADLIDDSQVQTPAFAKKIHNIIDNADVRAKMHDCALKQGTSGAASMLADVVLNVARQ